MPSLLPSELYSGSYTLHPPKSKFTVQANLTVSGSTVKIAFRYNPALIQEVKAMAGARWNPEEKLWSFSINEHNLFRLAYLMGLNPYEPWDVPLVDLKPIRPNLHAKQIEMVKQGLTRRATVLAAEMGTGKTLAAIEIMEQSGVKNWWWVGPKCTLPAIRLEFRKWKCSVVPRIFTYGELTSFLKGITQIPAPEGIIYDEASYLKNVTAARTLDAIHVTSAMRDEYANNPNRQRPYIILLTGTPAPKSPVDWWSLCHITQPGFLREGTVEKFGYRMKVVEQRVNVVTGGAYPHFITWRDSESKCKVCGMPAEDLKHDLVVGIEPHPFEPGTDEVSRLNKSMRGLVMPVFKRECLDLPDIVYKIYKVAPTEETMRLARLIKRTAPTAALALTMLRELSDGFQYTHVPSGNKLPCPACHSTGKVERPLQVEQDEFWAPDPESMTLEEIEALAREHKKARENTKVEWVLDDCRVCKGTRFVDEVIRTTQNVGSPKEAVLKNILEEHEEIGRLIVFGAFQGTIDHLIDFVTDQGWQYIRVDGRGWKCSMSQYQKPEDMLELFQDKTNDHKIVFIGQPGAAGMGLTLTASPTAVFYSNPFNAQDRIQATHRHHRPGMDVNLGATVIDIVHLPTDEYVLANLRMKQDLQAITLGKLRDDLNHVVDITEFGDVITLDRNDN